MKSINEWALYRNTFQTKEVTVYPGHPIAVAWVITEVFDNYEEAFHKPEGQTCCNALGEPSVPGSGGCVYLALDFLANLHKGVAFEDAVAAANEAWTRVDTQKVKYPERWEQGQDQADRVLPILQNKSSWWGESRP